MSAPTACFSPLAMPNTWADGTGGGMHPPDNPYARALQGDIKDPFMVGGYLLVAPLFTGQSERTVVLPRGKWYDFYTGEFTWNFMTKKPERR